MKKIIFFVLFSCFLSISAFADSPLTSTTFYTAYLTNDMVRKASEEQKMSYEMAQYLSSSSNPIDVKMAVINALYVKLENNYNSSLFLDYLAQIYKLDKEYFDLNNLNSDELLCYGYLLAMDNYNNPRNSLLYLNRARVRNPNSYTVNIIRSLVRSQLDFNSNKWCNSWKRYNSVNTSKKYIQDMNEEAKKVIYDYMVLYQKECK